MHRERYCLLALLLVLGCGPAVPLEELGHVVYEVPPVPGAEVPYPLPELKVTTGESEEGGPGADEHIH